MSHEDSPPSRTTARRCRPGACAPALHSIPGRRGCRAEPCATKPATVAAQDSQSPTLAECGRVVRPSCVDTEIRARTVAHSHGTGQIVICDGPWWFWVRRALACPIARIGARHSYRQPRREATRSRHVARPARRRAPPTSRFPGIRSRRPETNTPRARGTRPGRDYERKEGISSSERTGTCCPRTTRCRRRTPR